MRGPGEVLVLAASERERRRLEALLAGRTEKCTREQVERNFEYFHPVGAVKSHESNKPEWNRDFRRLRPLIKGTEAFLFSPDCPLKEKEGILCFEN